MAKIPTDERTSISAVRLLEELAHLLRLLMADPFRIRAFERASESIAGREDLMEKAQAGALRELEGVGKAIEQVLGDFFLRGETPLVKELKSELPKGILEIVKIPGIGPKKAHMIAGDLKIQSIDALERACQKGKLVEVKGFGEKGQAKILRSIERWRERQKDAN